MSDVEVLVYCSAGLWVFVIVFFLVCAWFISVQHSGYPACMFMTSRGE